MVLEHARNTKPANVFSTFTKKAGWSAFLIIEDALQKRDDASGIRSTGFDCPFGSTGAQAQVLLDPISQGICTEQR